MRVSGRSWARPLSVAARLGLLATLALGGGPGCRRHAQPVARRCIVDIVVTDRTDEGLRPATIDKEAVRAALERQQREAGVFSVVRGTEPLDRCAERFVLRLEVELGDDAREGKGVARAAVGVVIERVDETRPGPLIQGMAGGEKPYALEDRDVARVFTDLVSRTSVDLMRGLLERERLKHADSRSVAAAMENADPEVRLAAVTAAAERRLNDTVPALIARLRDEDVAVRDRALGALVEIGDRRAVAPLTRATSFQDVASMRKVIDAVASLGGDEARAYLELVASGHELQEIRALAREALGRMERKGPRGLRDTERKVQGQGL